MQDVDEERVVLEEIIGLQAAAVADPKVRQEFVVVGLEGKKTNKQTNEALHLFMGQQYSVFSASHWSRCHGNSLGFTRFRLEVRGPPLLLLL